MLKRIAQRWDAIGNGKEEEKKTESAGTEREREREKEIDIGRNVYGGSYFFRFTTWYARGAASL